MDMGRRAACDLETSSEANDVHTHTNERTHAHTMVLSASVDFCAHHDCDTSGALRF